MQKVSPLFFFFGGGGGLGCSAPKKGIRVWDVECCDLKGWGCRVQGSGFRV